MKNKLKIGDIGVCLSDHDKTGNLYIVDTIWANGEIFIYKIGDFSIYKYIHESDFWALI